MNRTVVVFLSLLMSLSFAFTSFADDMPAMESDAAPVQPMQKAGCAMHDGCSKHDGCMCGPGCACEDCPMKDGRMGMMDMGMAGMMPGKMGMRGDIDAMTWPRMQKSCKTPDFYLAHSDDLDLSAEQEDSLEKMQTTLKKEMILKGAEVKALELDLSEIVTKPDFKLEDALAKLRQIEDARVALRTSVLKYSAQARDVLSPEQIKSLKGLRRPGSYRMNGGMKSDMRRMMMEKMQRERMQQ